MGANVSSQSQTAISRIVNNALNKTVTNISTTNANSTLSTQTLRANFEDAKVVGNITIVQSSEMNIKALTKIEGQISNTMVNDIKNKISRELQQASKQKNSGLNLGQINTSVQDQHIETYIQNNLQNVVETSIKNVVKNDVGNSQIIEIRASRLDLKGDMNITQSSVISNIADSVASTVVKNTLTNSASNKDIAKLINKSSQVNAGISLFGGMIIFLIIGGVTYFFGKKVLKYVIPICILAMLLLTYYFYYKDQKLAMYICIGCTVILFGVQGYLLVNGMSSPEQLDTVMEGVIET